MFTKLLASLFCLVASYSSLAQDALWLDVPFVKQTGERCGAASVAMVMQYWETYQRRPSGQNSDFVHIQQALYSKQVHGIYASDIQRYLNSHGYLTYVLQGDETLLAHHLERGRPLIVGLRPGIGVALHYVVVTGIDPSAQVVLLNDPAQRKLLKVEESAFDKEWQATGNWTLLALPSSTGP